MGKKISFILKIVIVSLVVFLYTDNNFAQQDTLIIDKRFRITLKNDFEATGIVTNITPDTIFLKTVERDLKIPRKDIVSIKNLSSEESHVDSLRLVPDPNESRMLLGPTGKTLKGGKAYISAAVFFPYLTLPLFFPFSSFGITDYINIGAGGSPWPPLFYIAPKIRPLHTENVNLSFGFAYAQTYSFEDINVDYNMGLFYGVSSFDFEKYYTLSIGAGLMFNIDWRHRNKIFTYGLPHIILGFEIRTAKDFKLFSENWIDIGALPHSNFSVLSIGGRSFGKNIAFDFAIVGLLSNASFDVGGGGSHDLKIILMPWLSVAYNFNL